MKLVPNRRPENPSSTEESLAAGSMRIDLASESTDLGHAFPARFGKMAPMAPFILVNARAKLSRKSIIPFLKDPK